MNRLLHTLVLFIIPYWVFAQLLPLAEYHFNKRQSTFIKQEATFGRLEKPYKTTDYLINYFTHTLKGEETERDTIMYKGKNIIFFVREKKDSIVLNSKSRKILCLNSQVVPFHQHRYNITGLDSDSISKIAQYMRKLRYTAVDTIPFDAPQNCISYAIENIFKYNSIEPYPIFSDKTVLYGNINLIPLLDTFFIKEASFKKKEKKLKKYALPDKSFIAFRDEKGEYIHACYYMDGLFWSKNGMSPYTYYKDLSSIINRYRYTKNIEIYTFNTSVFNNTEN